MCIYFIFIIYYRTICDFNTYLRVKLFKDLKTYLHINMFSKFFSKKKEHETTITLLNNINWKCPEKLNLYLYEISVCTDFRRFYFVQIYEIFIPELNVCFNAHNCYNIIKDAAQRYVVNTKNRTELFNNWKPPKLLSISELNITLHKYEMEKVFDLIISSIKQDNDSCIITKLFLIAESNIPTV